MAAPRTSQFARTGRCWELVPTAIAVLGAAASLASCRACNPTAGGQTFWKFTESVKQLTPRGEAVRDCELSQPERRRTSHPVGTPRQTRRPNTGDDRVMVAIVLAALTTAERSRDRILRKPKTAGRCRGGGRSVERACPASAAVLVRVNVAQGPTPFTRFGDSSARFVISLEPSAISELVVEASTSLSTSLPAD